MRVVGCGRGVAQVTRTDDNRDTVVSLHLGGRVSRLNHRTLLTVVMDVFVVLAVAETARIVVTFFGRLASQGWAEVLLAVTDRVTIPLGIDAIKTPYGGAFDVDAAITVGAMLLVEWALSVIRSRGRTQSD